MVPSLDVVHRFLGWGGVVAYGATATPLLLLVHRRVDTLVRARSPGTVAGLAIVFSIFLVVAFVWGYPLANSGLLGPGSDRDENMHTGAMELLRGRHPYYQFNYFGFHISQMPGALMFGVPFAILGNAAYQNLFWLVVLVVTVGRLWQDMQRALVLTALAVFAAPVALREYVAGGDLLANSIYLPVFIIGTVHWIPRSDVDTWKKVLVSAALGVGLSSRAHFWLLVPLVWAALARRAGWRMATASLGVASAAFALVTLPFYLYDPQGFMPLRTGQFVVFESLMSPSMSVPLVLSFVAVSLLAAGRGLNGGIGQLMARSALVLAVPVVTVTILGSLASDRVELYYVHYGLSSVFFGLVGFIPPPRGDRLAEAPP